MAYLLSLHESGKIFLSVCVGFSLTGISETALLLGSFCIWSIQHALWRAVNTTLMGCTFILPLFGPNDSGIGYCQ